MSVTPLLLFQFFRSYHVNLDEYTQYDGLGLAELVRKGEVSPRELAKTALDATEKLNPQINAVVEIYHDRIESLDETQLGDGPFHGVPFFIKDVRGLEAGKKIEWGSKLCEGNTATEDTHLIEMWRAAGVNNIGRTNVPEFCIAGTTENRLYGNTSTPWRQGYSAGGSSGGAAAAVAAGIVPIAHGSDAGGSIRIPASLCGCVGLKPSRGRVSMGPQYDEGSFGLSVNMVQTRTVRDTAAMLDCIGIPQPGDPFVIAQPRQPYLSEMGAATGCLNIAFSTASLTGEAVHPETAKAVEQTAKMLEDMGHRVTEDAPPYNFEQVLPHFISQWFFGYDRTLESYAQISGRAIGPDTLEPCTLAIYEAAKKMDPLAILDAFSYFNRMRRDFGGFFRQYDIWLTPTTAQPAEPWGLYGQSLEGLSVEEYVVLTEKPVQFGIPYNITGCPAISLPLAQTSDGLPIGVQLGTRHGREDLLLRLSSALEKRMPWDSRVPPFHASR